MSDLKNEKTQALSEDDLDNVSGGYYVVVDTSIRDSDGNYEEVRRFDDRADALYYETMERSYKMEERK